MHAPLSMGPHNKMLFHRLGKLRILVHGMEEGKRCYLNPRDLMESFLAKALIKV